MNQQHLDRLIGHEGFRDRSYQDTGGVWTIGYGFTYLDGKRVRPGMHMTRSEADRQLLKIVGEFERGVLAHCTKKPTENQLAAMTSLAYNIGTTGFAKSAVCRLHNLGDFEGAARAFGHHVRDRKGNLLRGLVNRRRDEAALYLS